MTLIELRCGRLAATPETGRSPDQTYMPAADVLPGSLRISDLGHLGLRFLRQIDTREAYCLSRLSLQTTAYAPETGRPIDLLAWLQASLNTLFARPVLLGVP
jgi:hypothetical protein